jgi:hypothetical protein
MSDNDKELALRLFGCFAYAEHSLKTSGYLRRGRAGAEADWDSYARSIAGRFRGDADHRFRTAWRLLIANPPRKQVVRNGQLDWQIVTRPPGTTDELYGLLLVRRIRNNLFHGAKFLVGGEADFRRDRQLVEAAIAILEAAMKPPPRGITRG